MNLKGFYDNSPELVPETPEPAQQPAAAPSVADRFYDTMQPEQKPAGPPKPASMSEYLQSQHEKRTNPVDDNTGEQDDDAEDDEDRAAKLYNDTLYDEVTLVGDELPLPEDATPELVETANADYRAELKKLQMPVVLARQLTERFTAELRQPLSDEAYEAKYNGFRKAFADRLGGMEHVDGKLADISKLLTKADPAVVDALVQSGLNIDVDAMHALALHAHTLKARGRLR